MNYTHLMIIVRNSKKERKKERKKEFIELHFHNHSEKMFEMGFTNSRNL
jgi:hypothetical protein